MVTGNSCYITVLEKRRMKIKALLDTDIVALNEIERLLQEEGIEAHALSGKSLLTEEVEKGIFNIIFLHCNLSSQPGDTIISIIKDIKELDPRAEIICLCVKEDEAVTIEAIKSGATACIGYPLNQHLLKEIILNIKNNAVLRRETYQMETALHEKYTFEGMVSKSPAMLDIFSLIRRIAPYISTILITGTTGTGKEVIARACHNLGPDAKEPFVTCNCSGMVETLIESQLFGHVRGAFTGAISDKKGLFEAAGRGTIFLDEIGDMPLSFQPHLLRVLQNGEFVRVGSTQTMKTRCRIIAATNADLFEQVKQGLFREDLFFRLSVITINLPLLKDRKEDIPLLCYFFLKKLREKTGKDIRGITMAAKHLLLSYDWPGNIRELENVLERAGLITTANFIRLQDLPKYLAVNAGKDGPADLSLSSQEKDHIQRVLITSGGNRTKAASLLGISRRALFRKMKKYGLS